MKYTCNNCKYIFYVEQHLHTNFINISGCPICKAQLAKKKICPKCKSSDLTESLN